MYSRIVRCSSCGRELIDYYDDFNDILDESGKKQQAFLAKHNLKDCCRRYIIADPGFDEKVSAIIDYGDIRSLTENITFADIKDRDKKTAVMTKLEERAKESSTKSETKKGD